MKRADLIVLADTVVTCAGGTGPKTKAEAAEIGLIEDGAVVTVEGKIVEVGTRAKILEEWGGDRLDLPNTSVIPGLVDPHCHPLWAGDRTHEFELRARGAGYEEIHAAGGGIAHTVEETRKAGTEELKTRLASVVEFMAAHGTTTLEAKSGYGLSLEEELRQLEVIAQVDGETPIELVPTCLGAHAMPKEFEGDRQGFLDMITRELLPAVKERGLARFVDVFCERGAFSCQESEMVLSAAKELGFGLKIHAEEFSNLGGSRMAGTLGATSCDHLQFLADEDLPALKQGGTIPTVIPGTSFFLDMDVYAPARKLWDSGLPVALGTDFNAGSCLMPSMQMAMSLAVLKMKMTPEEALTAATLNAAYAVEMGQKIGSLVPGKQADMLVLSTPDWRDAIYRFGGNAVRAVVKKGVVLNTILRSPLGAPL
ncbi:MAG: imidazolonepropionase [Candidatus Eremiobacteraeota bacterium]|nr:imidazolonepropionase [Candidatus Eremiobacteraeota bacterium]